MKPINTGQTRILILGASGMLGSSLFRTLSKDPRFEVFGSLRDPNLKQYFDQALHHSLTSGIDMKNETDLLNFLQITKPDFLINCVGIIKQQPNAGDYFENISINSLFPQRLALVCAEKNIRFLHFSTDCVFSGVSGHYSENDFADANDLYGRTKFLGEVIAPNCITLRTSIIGHELNGNKSLIDWFLSQSNEVKGFTRAIFSGMPAIEIARVISEYIVPNTDLYGLYHLSAEPINKYELLKLVAKVYGLKIKITKDDNVVIDRSLRSDRFRKLTGFQPKAWSELVTAMYGEYLDISKLRRYGC
jgi:dTDP-4-dehydrorhamnose reductase